MHPSVVTDYLLPLLGLQLTSTRRAADLTNFQFGPLRQVTGGTIGSFALHVQCPWRLEGPHGFVTGRFDLWKPADGTVDIDWDSWDYESAANLQDAHLAALLQGFDPATRSTVNQTALLVVEAVHADEYGDLVLHLSGGFRLVVFPAGGRREHWRVFRPGSADPHLVSEAHAVSLHP